MCLPRNILMISVISARALMTYRRLYTMAVLFNCIAESESDLLVDPYLNSLRAPPEGR